MNITLLNSQEFNGHLRFTIDNDKMALLDQYYTSGLRLTYARNIEDDFLFFAKENARLQIEFTLLQQIYTPSNLMSANVLDFDRPYAGWLGLHTQLHQIKEKESIAVGVEMGVTGEQSGAGKLQSWWHNKTKIEVPTWEQEIGNKFLVNLNINYIRNLVTAENTAFDYKIKTVIGLKNIHVDTGFDIVFGKLSSFNNASRIGVVNTDSKKEFYGIIGFNYKQVFHNTLIQGDLRYDDTNYTTQITKSVLGAKTGLYYKIKHHLLRLEYHFMSKESPEAFGQIFGSLTYGCYF